MKVKTLCRNCGGVIDGEVFNADTGEHPCNCPKKFRNKLFEDSVVRFMKMLRQLPDAIQLSIQWKKNT